jgi:hypothetical protein
MVKRIFDQKTKRKLSGLLPFSPNAYVTWTPDEFLDFPIDIQPKINIRPLSKELIEEIRSNIQANKFSLEIARKAMTYCITGWRDLIDLGTELEVSFNPENVNQLPENLVWIIYKKVNEMTFGLSEAEKESLELQQRPGSGPLSKAAESAD